MTDQYIIRYALETTYHGLQKRGIHTSKDLLLAFNMIDACEAYLAHTPNHENYRGIAKVDSIQRGLETLLCNEESLGSTGNRVIAILKRRGKIGDGGLKC